MVLWLLTEFLLLLSMSGAADTVIAMARSKRKTGKVLDTILATLLENPPTTADDFVSRLADAESSEVASLLISYLERDQITGPGWHHARAFLMEFVDDVSRRRLRAVLQDPDKSLWARGMALELLGPTEDARAETRLDHLEMARLHTALLVVYAEQDPDSARFLATTFTPQKPKTWREQFQLLESCRWPLALDASKVYAGILCSKRLKKVHGLIRELIATSSGGRSSRALKLVQPVKREPS